MSALFHSYLCGRNAAEWLILMMNKQEMLAFRELFSKYCRQEINKGHCESDGCEFCSVNSAYDEIFNRFSDDEEDDTDK